MAVQHLNAPSSGVVHVRSRHRENFTILANRLAQRSGSAVTVGVAAYVLSVADGTPITIDALQAHFTEGETLLGRALNELEAEGWLERRLERTPQGRLTTRTFVYDSPSAPSPSPHPDAAPPPDTPAAATATTAPAPALVPAPAPVGEVPGTPTPPPGATPPAPAAPATSPASPASPASPQALGVLAALRTHDPRLALTERDMTRLAPAVDAWFRRGAWPSHVTQAMTTNLPERLTAGPAALLAYRLRELLPDARSAACPSGRPAPVPLQTCEGCDRAFRSRAPGHCRDCRPAQPSARASSQRTGPQPQSHPQSRRPSQHRP